MLKLTIDQTNELASQLTVEEVANLPEVIILAMAMPRLGHAGQYGFMISPTYFKTNDNQARIMVALMERLGKIKDMESKLQGQTLYGSKRVAELKEQVKKLK